MQVQKSFKDQREQGQLYLVPTPIGNLEDMTFRAVKILQEVALIAAEDTRTTGILLQHFEIKTKQISFHEHNAYEKIPGLLARLQAGESIAQVSDAGMPSISDPGHDLVKAAIEKGIAVIALPGASAGITALIASGLAPQPHIFYGFLPRKTGAQKRFLEAKKTYPETQIFYESPYRIAQTLATLKEVYGDRQVVLVRELTKLFEEYQRGTLSEIMSYLEDVPAKGECLVIVSGAEAESPSAEAGADPLALVASKIAQGDKPNQAIKTVAKSLGLNRQDLYRQFHDKNMTE
ncbi:16S rRNA (cytidine(1402)-2'-O)-methyltransferase [Streptococcus sp. DD12]|uniref:16S rRNA (cytidine(1402)-2'-O)-methyltransferase n=1 Tax=Streptococcus sp. DD12 TaxID=1777880 RepID=UPI00079BD534|nr:16S rRNA (cytidine(1402)-2'-O)-methyltransferase [Streptococcus sp. DD12]KXT76982.1 rRNA small subunit methyltransferase I [Streptococcus sp. DD12]